MLLDSSEKGRALSTFREQHRIGKLGPKLTKLALGLLLGRLWLSSHDFRLALCFRTRHGHLFLLFRPERLEPGLLLRLLVFLLCLCNPIRSVIMHSLSRKSSEIQRR